MSSTICFCHGGMEGRERTNEETSSRSSAKDFTLNKTMTHPANRRDYLLAMRQEGRFRRVVRVNILHGARASLALISARVTAFWFNVGQRVVQSRVPKVAVAAAHVSTHTKEQGVRWENVGPLREEGWWRFSLTCRRKKPLGIRISYDPISVHSWTQCCQTRY